VLDKILSDLGEGPTSAEIESCLANFTLARTSDAQAICELAMYNYIEMRHHVNQKGYYIRRIADVCLNKVLGNKWVPLYNAVTFSKTPYTQCIIHKKWQDETLARVGRYVSATFTGCILASLIYWTKGLESPFGLS